MPKTITPEIRQKCEELIYKTFSAIDPTGANTEYYQKLFSDMSDAEFTKLISGRLPFRYHVAPLIMNLKCLIYLRRLKFLVNL